MKSIIHKLILISVLIMVCFHFSCKETSEETASTKTDSPSISKEEIKKHLEELADDKYEGRMPFSRTEGITVEYIKNEFEAMGLLPANNGSYYQEVPMMEITSNADPVMKVKTKNQSLDLKFKEDYVIHAPKTVDEITITDSELVFCGFGINAPEKNWNDFEGVDMKGKIAVVLVNDPGFGSEKEGFFKGDIMTYYGRWTYKYEEAERQGARGILIIHETTSAGYPWFVPQSSFTGPLLSLTREDNTKGCDLQGWMHLNAAKKLFASCDLDLPSLIKAARKPGFKPVEMKASVSTKIQNEYKFDSSKNVAAYIKGKKSPEDFIVYTAHWDHIGIGPVVNGDSIYNGALDNASGVSTVMAIAKAFSEMKDAPDRSVLFLMVTAEEQGLLGSEYYVKHPLFPIENTVCNLNMDGVNPVGEMNDLTIVGIGHSDMDEIAEAAAKSQDRYVLAEQEPEKGYFFRSDHFNFAKAGVPALYAEGGYDHREKGKDYAREMRDQYTTSNYHRPSDEYDEATWNFDGMIQDGQLYLDIGLGLANSQRWPVWYDGSEFKTDRRVKG